jgi:hypothetical protein
MGTGKLIASVVMLNHVYRIPTTPTNSNTQQLQNTPTALVSIKMDTLHQSKRNQALTEMHLYFM